MSWNDQEPPHSQLVIAIIYKISKQQDKKDARASFVTVDVDKCQILTQQVLPWCNGGQGALTAVMLSQLGPIAPWQA